ncbi:tetratricopeptide repeat protein [Flavobacterium pectinovorum]|uniref:Tetratricopeptide repeat protein n=1 Tax=Flavobacterium pectinovorum TaxID=29533 RepID=A0AB36P3F9_9FLAO|nr:tetratricopeptide repeat protein [Flavobacterium pectinovorum]OXB06201.1 hypothetical protein B0A72_09410 [Flavobacterium pectinovorum]SHM97841.1 hypothetical protein SAMN05444387_3658 [Flavobacterium pectinovorum]
MNVTDYTYLINKPDAITEKQTEALGNVLIEFPYFQSARALRLKGLFNQNSFKYNYALKVTAAHTADRSILFDFITSETFTSIQNDFYDKKLRDLLNINVLDSEVVSPDEIKKSIEVRIDPIEQSILTSIKQATSNVFEDSIKTEEKPEDSIEDANAITIEEKKSVVNEEIVKTEDIIIKEDVLIAVEETEPAVFEEVKTHDESIDSTKEETIVIPVKETKHTFFEEVVDDEEIEDIKENFDPVIEKPVSTIEEIAPVVFEESKKHTEIRIDPIEESIYNSIKEATTVVFEESKPAEKEAAAIIVDTPKITEQHKEIASVIFEEVKITEEKPNEVIPTIPDQPTTVEESPKEVINFILEEPIFIEESKEIITDSIEESIIEKNILKTQFEETVKIAEENLEIGKPLDFSVKEKHSFQEWLQLARPEPIDRTNEIVQEDIKTVEENTQKVERTPEPIKQTVPETEIVEDEKKKKAELIDKFIETNPKISPIKSDPITLPPIQFNINQEDNSYLMTETLARVYLEQKKYTKAIQAYEILILKYPEKISFFADRISDIKILQQNNNNK